MWNDLILSFQKIHLLDGGCLRGAREPLSPYEILKTFKIIRVIKARGIVGDDLKVDGRVWKVF